MSDDRIEGYARGLFEIARAEGTLSTVEDECRRGFQRQTGGRRIAGHRGRRPGDTEGQQSGGSGTETDANGAMQRKADRIRQDNPETKNWRKDRHSAQSSETHEKLQEN